ncbi:MAG: integrase core domain-containing protein [bacterium]|nr:integrase core domain-containing protein [bacterium]
MLDRKKRVYVYTLLDVYSRWVYAWASPKANCSQSLSFVYQTKEILPSNLSCLQSDNGSEFSQHFTERIKIKHRHSRVRGPNDNAHLERFNRTLQEELLDSLPNNVEIINQVLPKYLQYYNTERLHLGLKLKTPSQVMPSY